MLSIDQVDGSNVHGLETLLVKSYLISKCPQGTGVEIVQLISQNQLKTTNYNSIKLKFEPNVKKIQSVVAIRLA